MTDQVHLVHYNHDRPHGALGYPSPAEFAAAEAPGERLEYTQEPSS